MLLALFLNVFKRDKQWLGEWCTTAVRRFIWLFIPGDALEESPNFNCVPIWNQYPTREADHYSHGTIARSQGPVLIVTPALPPTKSAFPIKSCQESIPHSTVLYTPLRHLTFVLNCSSTLTPKWGNNCGGKKQVSVHNATACLLTRSNGTLSAATFCYKLMYGIILRPSCFAPKALIYDVFHCTSPSYAQPLQLLLDAFVGKAQRWILSWRIRWCFFQKTLFLELCPC